MMAPFEDGAGSDWDEVVEETLSPESKLERSSTLLEDAAVREANALFVGWGRHASTSKRTIIFSPSSSYIIECTISL